MVLSPKNLYGDLIGLMETSFIANSLRSMSFSCIQLLTIIHFQAHMHVLASFSTPPVNSKYFFQCWYLLRIDWNITDGGSR